MWVFDYGGHKNFKDENMTTLNVSINYFYDQGMNCICKQCFYTRKGGLEVYHKVTVCHFHLQHIQVVMSSRKLARVSIRMLSQP